MNWKWIPCLFVLIPSAVFGQYPWKYLGDECGDGPQLVPERPVQTIQTSYNQKYVNVEKFFKERLDTWKTYRNALNEYSESVTQEERRISEKLISYYESELKQLTQYSSNIYERIQYVKGRLEVWTSYKKTIENYTVTNGLMQAVETLIQTYSEELNRLESLTKTYAVVKEEEIPPNEPVKEEVTKSIEPTLPAAPVVQLRILEESKMEMKSEEEFRYERVEYYASRFVSSMMNLAHIAIDKCVQGVTTVTWANESETVQKMESAYEGLRQEASGNQAVLNRLAYVKTMADKTCNCAGSCFLNFKANSAVVEELAKVKSVFGYSQFNQISSQWVAEWLKRLDTTLISRRSNRVVPNLNTAQSVEAQKKYLDLRQRSPRFANVVAWTVMRSEELLALANANQKMDMESLKAIIGVTMKINENSNGNLDTWLKSADDALNRDSSWTTEPEKRDFWMSADLAQIQARRNRN